jgi:hypothetical protein
MHTETIETFADKVRAIPGGEHLEMCFPAAPASANA